MIRRTFRNNLLSQFKDLDRCVLASIFLAPQSPGRARIYINLELTFP